MEEIKINLENLTDDERNTLMKLVERGNKVKVDDDKPKVGDVYWCYSDYGICRVNWKDCDADRNHYNLGNCFKSYEEAEFAYNQQIILTKWKRLAKKSWDGKEVDWNNYNESPKYYIYYDSDSTEKKIKISYTCTFKYENTYFSSIPSIKSAIEEIGEDNVEKYILEVED